MEFPVTVTKKSTIVRTNNDRRQLPEPPATAATRPVDYPAAFVRVARLADGSRVTIRPIRPDDEPRLIALFSRLSPRTVYERFFRTYRELPAEWYRSFANVDYRTRLALVAEHAAEVVGVARYEPGETPGTAEIAMVVEDAWQGRGLGTVMLGDLMRAAETAGITRFSAEVLAENHRMLRLLRKLTRFTSFQVSHGVATVEFVRDGQRAPAMASWSVEVATGAAARGSNRRA
jgi:RimJ/RimL family protein N-acetyltransferase